MLPVIPRVCGWDRTVTRLYDGLAAGVAGQAMLTKYPVGLYKVIPMKQHLMVDKMTGGLLLAAAALMDEESCEVRSCLATSGLFFLVAGFCTKDQPSEQARQWGPQQRQSIEHYAEARRPDAAAAGEHRAMSPSPAVAESR